MTPDEIRRYEWDGNVAATNKTPAMTLMAVGAEGVMVANSLDAKLLELGNLNMKKTDVLTEPRWITMAQNVAVVRSEGVGRFMMTVDVAAFKFRNTYTDAKFTGMPKAMLVLPTAGKSNPVLTPDARFLFTRGSGRLYRWKVEDYKLDRAPETGPLIAGADNGQIVVSPDGKYVAWQHPEGTSRSHVYKPVTGSSTFVFDVNDLKKPVAALLHGAKPTALAFDNQGQAFAGNATKLMKFGPMQANQEMKPVKEVNLDEYGKIRQIVVNPEGDKAVVLTDKELLRVDLTK